METNCTYTAFAGDRLIVSGDIKTMILRTKECIDNGETSPILIFEDQTGRQVDFDFRGTPDEALARLASHPLFGPSEPRNCGRTGPGRPKLGIVCREVSLLPRHWDWLSQQPGGASAALRRLVDERRKQGNGKNAARISREAAGKFMWTIAGNLPGFEEASRALYAGDHKRLEDLIRDWPQDIRKHLERLVAESARLDRESQG
ncbi:MAG: DUF2239 family protein [Candidatus Krumholzibacteria bacterium]|nr:DUF2239 family protein [Candidatus Krumholzibacteria bacterium]